MNMKLHSWVRFRVAKRTGRRMHLIKQVFEGIKVVKCYCWEAALKTRIVVCRAAEEKMVHLMNISRAFITIPNDLNDKLVLAVILLLLTVCFEPSVY